MPFSGANALEAEGLTRAFGDVVAVDGGRPRRAARRAVRPRRPGRRRQVHADQDARHGHRADLGRRPRPRRLRRPRSGPDQEQHRLHVAALQPVPRSDGGREPRLLRRAARGAARGEAEAGGGSAALRRTHRLREAPGAVPLGRDEAEARAGRDAHPRARRHLPRRADDRRRPRLAARVLAHPLGSAPARDHARRRDARTWTRPSAARRWRSWTPAASC